jgi:excisionase family DNA binding protein
VTTMSHLDPEASDRGVPELLTIGEAADYLRMSPSWVRKATADGRLPVVQLGARVVYRRVDLAEYVQRLAGPRRVGRR